MPLTMALSRKSFLLRVDPALLDAVQRWANDDLRSLNGHIEFLLRRALAQAGRTVTPSAPGAGDPSEDVTPRTGETPPTDDA